jgi:NAD-dependent SIR2 family protein deacetylase
MPNVEQNKNNISTSSSDNSSSSSSIPISLHDALTNSQCSKCGKQLEWEADFNNFTQPKYTSKHRNQDYIIRIDTVKVEIAKGEESSLLKEEEEPRAIKMAQALLKEERI